MIPWVGVIGFTDCVSEGVEVPIARLPWLRTAAACVVSLLAGCSYLGAGSQAESCGANAYDSVMFNSDRYDSADRAAVASLLRGVGSGEVPADGMARIIAIAGERDARRMIDEFATCMGE